MKSLESEAIARFNNICTGNITLGHRTDFANSIGTYTWSNTSQHRFKKQFLLHYYETYLQLDKELLNNLQRKAAKIKQTKNKRTNR